MSGWLDIRDPSDVAHARLSTRGAAQALGLSAVQVEEAVIVASELCSNQIKHAGGGRFMVQGLSGPGGTRLGLVAADDGPGIADLAQARRDGMSSCATAGIGLGAIERLSHRSDVLSTSDDGTLWACEFFVDPQAPQGSLEVAGLSSCHPLETECGDQWRSMPLSGGARLVVVDGLGHGPKAHEVAVAIADRAVEAPLAPLPATLGALAEAFRGSRGAVIALADLDLAAGRLAHAGLGNIGVVCLNGSDVRRLPSRAGYLGTAGARPHLEQRDFLPGDLVILHSDGLRDVGTQPLPRLREHSCLLIAGWLMSRPALARVDDACVVVARCRPASD